MRIVFHVQTNALENGNILEAVRNMVLASRLPVVPAKVNKAWPRLSYGPAAGQGQQTEREYLDIYLRTLTNAADVKQRLEKAAPQGLQLLAVERVPYPLPSVQNLAAAARYRIQGDFSRLNVSGRKWETFSSAEHILITRRAANGIEVTLDAAPYVVDSSMRAPDEILCTLQRVQDKWMRPEWLIAAWLGTELPAGEDAFTLKDVCITRQCLLWRDSQGELHPL